ncbi:hypothetical protein Salat_1400300 [Sesamum alatum]|uniref:Retrovirus-related Pol polyprotein from transposon TNT 1-94 n=1 Tax=Sesamum alatum TaxID=300844 RepID=A0AAE2CLA1_9LAMI|nr:hypothetical protein Salat_1400300 [Sesamum alatum]
MAHFLQKHQVPHRKYKAKVLALFTINSKFNLVLHIRKEFLGLSGVRCELLKNIFDRNGVEIFDGTGHFGMWQGEVLDALFQQGLDIALEKLKPGNMEEEDWNYINRLACATIRSCLSKEQKYAFSKETSAHKLWTTLEEKFLKKNIQNKLYMKKRLFRFSYVSGTTMNDHISNFNQLVTNLMNMDETFKDQDLALILLGSLPEEFEVSRNGFTPREERCISS